MPAYDFVFAASGCEIAMPGPSLTVTVPGTVWAVQSATVLVDGSVYVSVCSASKPTAAATPRLHALQHSMPMEGKRSFHGPAAVFWRLCAHP